MSGQLSNKANAQTLSELTIEDEVMLERLVDNELSEQERREILLKLETISNGWRSCAIAFLEAQTFKAALKDIAQPRSVISTSDEQLIPSVGRSSIPRNALKKTTTYGLPFVSAATFLCALGLFWFSSNDQNTSKPLPGSSVQVAQVEFPSQPNEPTASSRPVDTLAVDRDEVGLARSGGLVDAQTSSAPIRTVTFNCPKHGLTNVSAPCIERDSFDPQVLNTTSLELPNELFEQLSQDGGRVNAKRESYHFPLEDGRVLILPVDSYEVRHEDLPIR